jgi:hypothetical protein
MNTQTIEKMRYRDLFEPCDRSGLTRARDRCWRAGCTSCSLMTQQLMLRYLSLALGRVQNDDRKRDVKKRRLLFVTIRCRFGVDLATIRWGISHSWKPWFARRTKMLRYFGIIVPSLNGDPAHVHLVVEVEKHLKDAGDVWAAHYPPTAERWADTDPKALHLTIFRNDDEVQPRSGGPILRFDQLRHTPATDALKSWSRSSSKYLVRHVPVQGVPPNQTFTVATRNFATDDLGSFEAFRDEWAERELPSFEIGYWKGRQQRHPRKSTQQMIASRAPRYNKTHRDRFGRAAGAYRDATQNTSEPN